MHWQGLGTQDISCKLSVTLSYVVIYVQVKYKYTQEYPPFKVP